VHVFVLAAYLEHSQFAGGGSKMQSRLSIVILAINNVFVVVVVAVVVTFLLVVVVTQVPRPDRCILAQLADHQSAARVVWTQRRGVQCRTVVLVLDGPRRTMIQQQLYSIRSDIKK